MANVNDAEKFLKDIRGDIETRISLIRTSAIPEREEQIEVLEQQLQALRQEQLMLESMLTAGGAAPAKTPAAKPPKVAKAPKRERAPRKTVAKKPAKKTPTRIRISEEIKDATWHVLRNHRNGAVVTEIDAEMEYSSTYIRYALDQLVEDKRAVKEDGHREINGRQIPVKVYKIVSPQREGADAPPSRPRHPTPEQEARAAAPDRTPPRGAPVAGTGRSRVIMPNDRDTAALVLEAVKLGWQTLKDGKEHIRVVRPELRDPKTGLVTQERAEVRVSSTPRAPALDKIRKEFSQHGVTYNR